jgi:hypothetical protein
MADTDGRDNSFASGIGQVAPQSVNAVNQQLASFVRGGVNQLPPALQGLAGGLLDNLIGTPNDQFTNSGYRDIIARQTAQARFELNNIVAGQPVGNATTPQLQNTYDWRARLRPKNGGKENFYAKMLDNAGVSDADYLLKPIEESGGLVWQYTPQIFLSGMANYDSAEMQGMNYPINTYQSSTPPDIPVAADFTADDIYEARYLLAVLTFLKIATKGYFGDQAVAAGKAGTPPPVMVFEYLGDHGFNKVPVVVQNYTVQYPDDVDYVPVQVNTEITYVPTRTNIMVNLKPTYTPHKLRRHFNLESLASGQLYKGGFI